jgi:hypothetical protein
MVAKIIADLEEAIARGSHERRLASLRQVTDLFLRDAEALTDEQIELFDIVIALRSLAHDEIVVARPILSRSERLTEDDLVAVAIAKGRDHMLAISERPCLRQPVTDFLVSRGDRVVVHAVAGNPGARFTEGGITKLIDKARADEALQTLLSQRTDIPDIHMRQLVVIAKEAARRRLVETLPQATPPAVNAAVERSAATVEVAMVAGRDYGRALAAVQELSDAGVLDETHLRDFADEDRFEDTVSAIACLVGVSVPTAERLFSTNETDLLLVVSKSQDWVWPTVRALAKLRDRAEATPARLKRTFETYEQLSRRSGWCTSSRCARQPSIRPPKPRPGGRSARSGGRRIANSE